SVNGPASGHDGNPHGRRVHRGSFAAPASAASRCRTRVSQISFDKSVLAPARHSDLKCAYSSAQVGSSCTSVSVSSGGCPLGRTRPRLVNSEGPHLHSDWICDEPRSARTSQVK